MKVKLDELKDLVDKALAKSGYDENERATISEVMLYAQLRGNNQGVVKLIGPGYPKGATADIEVVKESKTTALLDAHQNAAMVAINQATDLVITKAHESGIAVVGVCGINTSSGALGFYARKIARENLAGFVFSSAMETVAASGSSQAIFGTNPLAIGVPGKEKPLVLDMATAAMAYFGVVEANTAGKRLPEDIAYDKEGNPTTNPSDVIEGGALRTFDGSYKGSHLSMMVQILAGPLVGAAFMGEGDGGKNWGGHLLIAFDPETLGGTDHLRQSVDSMVGKVKATKKLPGTKEILMPSERGDRVAAEVEQSGEIDLEDNLYQELKKAAEVS